MPGQGPLYSSAGRETAYGFERRLGGRMTLFATTGHHEQVNHGEGGSSDPGKTLVLAATHAQTSWKNLKAHTSAVSQSLTAHIASLSADGHNVRRVLLGGDTWRASCAWLGMTGIVTSPSPTNRVSKGKVRLWGNGNDDYICGQGVSLIGDPKRFPTVGRPMDVQQPEFVLSDHVFVTAVVNLSRPVAR